MTKATRRGQLLIVVSLLASLLLASCGGGATPAPTAVPTSPPEPTEAPEPTPAPTATPEPALIEQGSELAILANHTSERLADWTPTMAADALFDNLNDGDDSNDPFIVSVRSPEHYALGHVPGAYNIPWKEIANPDNLVMLPTDQQIVVYCYTGHTGQVAATSLALLGYDVTNLKFGMMGWTDDDEVLATARYAGAAGYPTETEVHEFAATAGSLLQAAGAYFGEGFKLIAADALFDNLNDGDDSNDPYILDIRSAEDYATGHIPGAVNVGGGALFDADTLDDLPTEGQVVVTCYSGQTAGQVVSVLNLLGYDAYSLKFGMPSWAILTESGLWRDAMSMGYPTETEAHQLP